MTVLLTYLSKVIICSAVLYGYYYIALRNNRFHQWNRYYLVLITLISLLTPLLKIPLPGQATESSAVLSYTARIVNIRETVISASPGISSGTVLNTLYIAVIGLLLTRTVISLFRIKNLIRRSQVQEIPPYRFVKNKDIKAPFSFFSYIFWDHQTSLNSPEGQQIFKHELVHLQEKHSTDKLFMELVTAVCWINPFFHLIKRELALVHEFLADKKAAGEEIAGYAQTILQMAFQSKQFSITNDFFHPPIKRRILMLTQFHTPRFSYLRRIMVLPLAAFIFCSLAFVADKRPSAIPALTATNTVVSTPSAVPAANLAMDTTPVKKVNKTKDNVYTFVEQPPSFPGGEEALAKYLSRNIRYPKTAQEKNISGTVFVSYVVNEEGNITDVRLLGKNPGFGLAEEAIRVVKEMPQWVPGKHQGKTVSVQFNLPIRFMLDTGKQAPKPGGQTVNFPPPNNNNNEVFTFVEHPPKFPGGENALGLYLNKNIRYPEEAQKAKIGGTTFVQFVVDADGSIRDVKTIGAKKGYGLEDEAIRVVKAMPKWEPGVQNEHQVAVQFNLPIRFSLQN
ncbi:TonB family C-terminal domain-containing protein [Chitinophaga ginsengisegetis]|uniref:TonB family C-terminal domain-containing protein n=1 Tax=Chitinophaga ginsengisegetis TaxID=393003 RepID=A0A1T5NYR1_9BACT|nr:M56 family metallopeptidase [Chitinophaga ginsengisegetis]SKD05615.1 TonB family C-terminal domain-containing protein [Chitinophaga ginsengisegetis]